MHDIRTKYMYTICFMQVEYDDDFIMHRANVPIDFRSRPIEKRFDIVIICFSFFRKFSLKKKKTKGEFACT